MYDQWSNALLAATAIIALSLLVRYFRVSASPQYPTISRSERSTASAALAEALPERTFFSPHPAFTESMQSYWAMQERDIVPQCIVRPRTVKEVSTAVAKLKRDYDLRNSQGSAPVLFAVRSGGRNPVAGASNIRGSVVIDLRLINEVVPSEDGSSVAIGTGARWLDVSKVLDQRGLAVAGGRNSSVGVGGLILGGGLSYFSPRVGFVCNNILSYEVVLADGSVVTASKSTNPSLWRALKGGSNNFGIVTKFVARSFPSRDVWSGFLYMTSWKAAQCIQAFYDFTRAEPDKYDEVAAGPLVCFTYVQPIGLQLVATNLVYTKPEKWPPCFDGFKSIGRLWSTIRIRSLTSATDELDKSSPAGFRQIHITTTFKNDHDTLTQAHFVYERSIGSIRRVQGMIWTLVFQPLLPEMARKGDPDCLGLRNRTEPLVIVELTVVWRKAADDQLVDSVARSAIDEIDRYAEAKGTADSYRYLNYCTSGQDPFSGYVEENKRFLQETSRTYDPDGLFQRACVGGFKLDMRSSGAVHSGAAKSS